MVFIPQYEEDLKRPICLHFHIFKNAGMTFGWILEKNFDANHVRMDTDIADGILPLNVVINYLQKNKEVKALSAHLMKFPIPEIEEMQIIPILFIRHPLDRIFSIYHYNRMNSNGNSASSKKAKSSSLKEYIKWEMQQEKRMNMKNFQTIYLSKNDNKSNVTFSDLDVAIKRLETIPILGVVDRFDESMTYAEEVLQEFFPKIDFSYTRQNISSKKRVSIEEKIKLNRSKIGDKLMDELIDRNKLDLELYLKANEKLDSRIQNIPEFESKLIKFRERCRIEQEKNSEVDSVFKHPRLWYSLEKKYSYYERKNNMLKKFFKSLFNK